MAEKMNKVAIDMRAIPKTGIARYSQELLKHIPLVAPDLDCLPLYQKTEGIRYHSSRAKRAIRNVSYEFFGLARDLTEQGVFLFHCTKNHGIPIRANFPIITTVHDLIPLVLRPDYLTSPQDWAYYRLSLWITLRYSKALITISDFSRQELIRYFPTIAQKIVVIPQGCDPSFSDGTDIIGAHALMKTLGIERPYILTMGGTEPRKNVAMLVRAFKEEIHNIPHDLVVIGGPWQERKSCRPTNFHDRVHYISGLSDYELAAAYMAADLFVYPSLYEGFGLPILEAMSCGTPVVAHSGSCIPEVAGEAALLADMRSKSACMAAIHQALYITSLRAELIAAGLEQASRFTWEKTATLTAQLYRDVITGAFT